MKKNEWIKSAIKQENVSQVELSAELKKSEDSISRVTNNPTEAPMSYFVSITDYLGVPAEQFVKGMSGNRCASDGLLPDGKKFSAFKEEISSHISDFDTASTEGCQQVKKTVDALMKNAVVYVTGGFASGKFTAAENFTGTSFRSVGEKARGYERILIKTDTEAGVEFNYPLGEYLYTAKSDEILTDIIVSSNSKELINDKLTPAPWGESQDSNYVLFSNSEKLRSVSVICSNWINAVPIDESSCSTAETETKLIALSDVVVIMLDPNTTTLEKYMHIIQSAFERWKWNLADHLIFAASKSDRYSVNDAENMCRRYSEMIKAAMHRIAGSNDEEQDLIDAVADMVFPYSSIYKVNSNGKSDAGLNGAFTHRLQQDIISTLDIGSRSAQLVQALGTLRKCYQPNETAKQNVDKMKQKIHLITEKASADFKKRFNDDYDNVVNVENISRLISDNKIERKQEDRKRLVTLVDSVIIDIARKAALMSLEEMRSEFDELGTGMIGEDKSKAVHDRITMLCDRLSTPDGKSESGDSSNLTGNVIGSVLTGLTLGTALLSVTGITMAITAFAAATVSSYYAQTNYEKNMARKIVSSYDSQDVRERISAKMVNKYFKTIQAELLIIAGGTENCGDPEAVALIDSILELIDGQAIKF